MKSILDPKFKYTNSVSTDLRKTFARARRKMEQARPFVEPAKVLPFQQERSKKK